MTKITFHPLPTETVAALRAGGPDANGLPAEHAISDGAGNPCRHCLRQIPTGAGMLVCAHRPFGAPKDKDAPYCPAQMTRNSPTVKTGNAYKRS